MDQKRISGMLMAAAGTLFLIAGAIRGLQQPLWLVLGAVLLVLGVVIIRQQPRR